MTRFTGFDPVAIASWQHHWAPRNIYAIKGAHLVQTGAVIPDEQILPEREALASEYVCDYLRPNGLFHNLAAVAFREGPLAAILCVLRDFAGSSYADHEVELVQMLLPHLQRAIAIQRKLHGIALDRDAAHGALDRIGVGVLILDKQGKLLFLNRASQAILDQRDGLVLLRDGLAAARPHESAALRRLIATVIAPISTDTGGVLHIARPSGKRPFAILAAPLRMPNFALAPRPPAAVVFITDPERRLHNVGEMLGQLHGLTPAESKVTMLLLEGASVREVSDRLGITWNTARTHVQRVLAKTNTRTQADLIRALADIAGIRLDPMPPRRTLE